jgi:hypothetical protein
MTRVYVDVDLDEINDDDLVKEICYRIRNGFFSKGEIEKIIKSMNLNVDYNNLLLLSKTMDDISKIEHLNQIWDQYNQFEFEEILKKKY